MQEVWKPIIYPDLVGRYEVSNMGRVKRLARAVPFADGRIAHLKEKFMAIHAHPKGYLLVRLTGKETSFSYRVHRLVADHFIPNPDNLPEVNHKDEDKTNNSVENLEWCTHQYNSVYGTRLQRIAAAQRGREVSEEHRQKISKALKGRTHSPEAIEKFKISMKDYWARNKKAQ